MTTEIQTQDAPKRAAVLTFDKTSAHSTVHGDRTPEDPHYGVAFWQDNLPFQIDGSLCPDNGVSTPVNGFDAEGKPVVYRPLWDDKRRAHLARKLDRLARFVPEDEPVVDEYSSPAAREKMAQDVNLAAWLKGTMRYESWLVQLAAKLRFGKNYARTKDLVVDLVFDERLVPEDEVSPAFRHYLDGFGAADSSVKNFAAA